MKSVIDYIKRICNNLNLNVVYWTYYFYVIGE